MQLGHLKMKYGKKRVRPTIASSFFSACGLTSTSKLQTLSLEGIILTSVPRLFESLGEMRLTKVRLEEISELDQQESEGLPLVWDLAPLACLQTLQKLRIVQGENCRISSLDVVLQSCTQLSMLDLNCTNMLEPLRAGSASVKCIKLGSKPLYEYAEQISMSLFPCL